MATASKPAMTPLAARTDSQSPALLNGVAERALAHLRGCDPVLASIIARVGDFKMQYREPVFASLVRSIVFQQLHGKAATTIFNRLLEIAGGELTPESILKLRTSQMRAVGVSNETLSDMRGMANRTKGGNV